MKRLFAAALVGCASVMVLVPAANAATTTGTLNVNVTLTSKCEIQSVGAMNFTYESFQATDSDAQANVSWRCTNTLPATMDLDTAGPGYSGTVIGLNYGLYWDAGRTDQATQNIAGVGGPGANKVVYGRMGSGQSGDCAVGSCSGGPVAHTVTITY